MPAQRFIDALLAIKFVAEMRLVDNALLEMPTLFIGKQAVEIGLDQIGVSAVPAIAGLI